jgi:outer membrane protein insertion porin family
MEACRHRRARDSNQGRPWLAVGLILLVGSAVRGRELRASEGQAQQPQQAQPAQGDKPADSQSAPPQNQKPPAEDKQKSGGQKPAEQQPAPKPESQKPANEQPPVEQQLQLEAPQAAPTTPETPKIPAAAGPSRGPSGQSVIEGIIFRGNRRIPAATLRARIFSHVGDVYDENALERDFMALWNTGFLDDIRLEVTDGKSGGKIITFYVREKKLVRSIDYKGLSTVQQSDVLDRFKEKKVGLSIQSQYDPVIIKRAEVVLEQLLAEHGRQFAAVHARTRNIPPNSVALTFIVLEGPKVKVGNVHFSGNTVFSDRRLERSMKYSRAFGAPPWFYWFHKTYDKEKIQADLENIRSLYQDHGYFTALVNEPQTKMTDTKRRWPFFFWSWGHGKRVDLSIPVEEGPQYRLGKFTIRGNKLFKQQVLAPVLQMKSGDIFNLSKVRKALENYKKLYGEFGYINFVATPDPERDDKKHLVNLALDFDEEKQFVVHRIEFSGNTKTRDKVIRRELLINEGAIFDTALWDYSTLRINQLGFFDPIKKEDYEIKQNEKQGTVDVNLKVKEKGRNSIGFSGGVSGIAGNFVGINYATNNFLGLGETLSIETQFGSFEKLYSFGFTEPYLLDHPLTSGFTIFKSDYHFDQLRQTAVLAGLNPTALQQSGLGTLFQNFQQNSSGFTVFASYPLRHPPFARLGLTYSYSVSSVQTFNPATQSLFQALSFGQFQGPNQLTGITTSQVMPTFLYNTLNGDLSPTSGKYIYAALSFSGSILGGNVNTIRPVIEAKYFHPINHRRNTLGFHFLGSTISGFGGEVPPPFSRIYMGGEYDIRGFDIYTVSPLAFFPTISQVCNRDNLGRTIQAVDSTGHQTGTCGSFTRFPYNTIQFPGGDTELLTNFEYRIPIAGPVTLAPFVDVGTTFILRPSQLKIQPTALNTIANEFPYFKPFLPTELKPIGLTNFRPRASTGLELQVVLPIVNAPFRVFYGYNFLRLNDIVTPPRDLPPLSMFPNQATYNDVLPFFKPFPLRDRRARLGFTVARQF